MENAEWKMREQIAGVKNAGVENARANCRGGKCRVENAGTDRRGGKCGSRLQGGNCRSRLTGWKAEPILYSDTASSYFLKIVSRLLSEDRVIFIAF